MSMLVYAGIAVMVTQSVVSKAVDDGAGFVPETVVGLGAVAMVASVFASLAAVKQHGPRAIVRGVILAAVLAEVPAICSLAATVLTGKLGDQLVRTFVAMKRFEVERFQEAVGELDVEVVSEWEIEEYASHL